MSHGARPVAPGGTIGILGGGQLGRMLAIAAARLGYRCHVLAPEDDCVAAEVACQFTCAEFTDGAALSAFASSCDVVTYEFENVPVDPLGELGKVPLRAPAKALEIAQDRIAEKTFVADLGGTTAPFVAVRSKADLARAVERVGVPGILKTVRDGYDGKGQWRIAADTDLSAIDLPGQDLVYEGFVEFDAEFSVILARGTDGDIVYWDSARNDHASGILSRCEVPASDAVETHVPAARALAAKVAEALGYIGVLTLEFFATRDGPVFNEMAPRVHNSGHWTIEGTRSCQFENHIRAICGLPLGDTSRIVERVTMHNLIGAEVEEWPEILADRHAHLHIYGKQDVREGRKMGHVTRLFSR